MDLNRFRKLCGIPAPIEETTKQDFEWDRQRIDMLQRDELIGTPERETDQPEDDAPPAEPKPQSVADTVVLDLDGYPITKATHDAVLKEIAFARDLKDFARRCGIPLTEKEETRKIQFYQDVEGGKVIDEQEIPLTMFDENGKLKEMFQAVFHMHSVMIRHPRSGPEIKYRVI